jgi:uncharacterized membrane protein
MLKFKEKIPRSIAKLITWRILISFSQFAAGWFLTGNVWAGVGLVGYSLLINSLLYFGHERVWNASNWGKLVVERDDRTNLQSSS